MNGLSKTDLLSHHAYGIVGGEEAHAELIAALVEKHGIRVKGNADFFDRAYDSFAIDDARELKSLAETRPAAGADDAKKIFIVAMKGITPEAQNALLKLLEEPPEYARFYLIIPSAHLFLPTVKSRLRMVGGEAGAGASGSAAASLAARAPTPKEALSFLAASVPARLEQVKKLMDEISKEKRPKSDALDLLNALEEAVRATGLAQNAAALEALETARSYMYDRSPSLKMLLEYAALAV